ncbi:MAG: hypothetical protein ABW321_33650 [Polyangiales bacterium]
MAIDLVSSFGSARSNLERARSDRDQAERVRREQQAAEVAARDGQAQASGEAGARFDPQRVLREQQAEATALREGRLGDAVALREQRADVTPLQDPQRSDLAALRDPAQPGSLRDPSLAPGGLRDAQRDALDFARLTEGVEGRNPLTRATNRAITQADIANSADGAALQAERARVAAPDAYRTAQRVGQDESGARFQAERFASQFASVNQPGGVDRIALSPAAQRNTGVAPLEALTGTQT